MLERFLIHDDIATCYRESGYVVLIDLHSHDAVMRAREEPSRADAEAVFAAAGDGR
jgi:hypothetical protein